MVGARPRGTSTQRNPYPNECRGPLGPCDPTFTASRTNYASLRPPPWRHHTSGQPRWPPSCGRSWPRTRWPRARRRTPAARHTPTRRRPFPPFRASARHPPARDRGPVTGVWRRGRAPRQGFARRAPATHVGVSPPHARRVVDRASSWRGVEVTFSCPSISCQISGDGGKQLRLYNGPFNVNVVGEGIRWLQNDLAIVRCGPGRGRFSGLGADRPRHCYLARPR